MTTHLCDLEDCVLREENALKEAVELLRALTYAAWRFHDDTGHDTGGALSCDWICDEMREAKAWLERHGHELAPATSEGTE